MIDETLMNLTDQSILATINRHIPPHGSPYDARAAFSCNGGSASSDVLGCDCCAPRHRIDSDSPQGEERVEERNAEPEFARR